MNKARFQKVNRAAVATVLAASGAVAVLPINDVKAASPFTDLEPSHFAYDAILNLYERNIISGYGNGKFGPNDSVTRGQAAKMLAQVLELDTTSIVNPNFKDVKTTDPFYPYIAALANEGVINGFVDQTYRPNEPITRGQMAIVITKGFEFKQATLPLTHTFDDVTVNTYERFFIQTIYDLGITKGKTERTFEPYSRVTRGEMAVFINRAENARAIANPVYEVTNVHTMGNITYAYVNGVKHTVDSRLKDIFNEANAAALEGALIDGDISDTKRIVSLSKITFTASGSQGRSLQFNGRDSVFAGDVAITGSYIKFRNWSINGEVSIEPETIRTIRAAIEASPFKRVASLGNPFGFIDWGQETDPDDYDPIGGTGGNGDPWTGPADGSEDGTDLVSPPTTNESGYYKRMAPVQRYIEFIDVDIRYLVIRQTGTHVTSTKTLPHVTVTGNVKAYELYANVGTMYIETDVNTTMYGVSEIEEVYKNSHKSVNLDADTTIDLMVVDNSNGWIDLGEHAYIDKVIIPPNKMPNDIFNDFINDNDLIGNIEDPWGNEVDRDPIENTIVPDLEDPELRIVEIETELDTAEITFNSNEDGMLYYIVKKEKDGEPSIREIIQNTGSRWAGRAAVSAGKDVKIEVTQLDDQTDYVVYAVAVDEAGNISDKTYEFFQITDAAAPVIRPVTATGLPGGKRIKVDFNPNEAGEYYYYYTTLENDLVDPVTTKRLVEELSKHTTRGGSGKVTTPGLNSFILTELDHEKEYVIYLVMKDESGNFMAEPIRVTAKTLELDDSHPFIPVPGELHRVSPTSYEFYFDVSEPLDPVSANNPNNYDLFGTAILNVEGQPTTIKPEYVEYIEGSKRVKIRIPSATALVLGDTIEIKVLPGVKDLAENEFINLNVTNDPEAVLNTAKYTLTSDELPELKIEKFLKDPTGKTAQLTFKSNKAGTYYYMIVPNSYTSMPKDPRDFYEEFTNTTTPWEPSIPYVAKQGESGNNTVVVGSQMIDVIIPDTSATPFESYSLYMIVKDRSGQLTSIEKIENIIDDSRAPFIRSIDIQPVQGKNTEVKIQVNSSEKGVLFYKRLEKYLRDENGEYELDANGNRVVNPEINRIEGWRNKLATFKGNINIGASDTDINSYITEIRSWKNEQITQGLSSPIFDKGLLEHTDYVYFFAAADSVGNLTVFQSNSTILSETEDYDSSEIMKGEVFTDGIAPFIVGDTLKLVTKGEFNTVPKKATTGIVGTPGDGYIEHITQQTFMITFSEALKLQADLEKVINTEDEKEAIDNLIEAIEKLLPSNIKVVDMEWEDTTNIETWEQRRLIFSVDSRPTADITIDAEHLKELGDIINNPFNVEKTVAEYRAPAESRNTIVSVLLKEGPGITIGDLQNGIFSSALAQLTLQINSILAFEQEYYYVVQNEDGALLTTAEDVISVAKNTYVNPTGIFQVGQGKVIIDPSVQSSGGVSIQVEIKTPEGNPRLVFTTGQRVYFVTMDKYGNIISNRNDELYKLISK